MKYYETKEFLATQKEWYQKLKDEGFDDKESFDRKGQPKMNLKGARQDHVNREDFQEVYSTSIAEAFDEGSHYHSTYEYYHAFRTVAREIESGPRPKDQELWIICDFYGEGKPISEIAYLIEKPEVYVRRRIQAVEQELGINRGRNPDGK